MENIRKLDKHLDNLESRGILAFQLFFSKGETLQLGPFQREDPEESQA